MKKIVMGSICLAGVAQMPGFDCDGSADISFGDTVPGQELQWIKLKNGLLIADRCVCTNISWEQLDKKGFVLGTPITIEGEAYWCRCLQVGSEEGEINEWDSALDGTGEDNNLWHWEGAYFWGQEISKRSASSRAVRGWVSARYWNYYNASSRIVGVGFRPALEYLGSEPCSPDTLLDKMVKAYCSGGVIIEGRLVDFSDYDITFEHNYPTFANYPWATKEGRNIIISRENIIGLKEG